MRKLEVTEIKIKTVVDITENVGNLEAVLSMRGEGEAFLCAQLLDEEGTEADRIFPVPMEEKTDFCMRAETVRLWNPEQPYLYELVLELRDAQMMLLGSTSKKIAFFYSEEKDGVFYLNGKEFPLRCVREQTGANEEAGEAYLRCCLRRWKQQHYNAVCADVSGDHSFLRELCAEYGLYLIEKDCGVDTDGCDDADRYDDADRCDDTDRCRSCAAGSGRRDLIPISELPGTPAATDTAQTAPEFDIQVVQQGALIENRSVFTNASVYELYYEVRDLRGAQTLSEGVTEADVPAGSSRYIEVPFTHPAQSGEFLYRVTLRLKKDAPWAQKACEIAAGESVLTNLYDGEQPLF